MTRLRGPDGCPWDHEQTLKTLRPYLLEEAHEVLEVLDALDDDGGGPRVAEHKEELGDLLLQIVFQTEIQREHGRFDIGDVCAAITDKLVRRHPHIFALEVPEGTPGSKEGWEAIKRKERAAKAQQKQSALDGVPKHLPALLRAYRTGEKARGAGFDWPSHHGVVDKIKEELGELEEALATGDNAKISHELGDLLYALVNLSRHFEIDPEGAVRATIARFEERFRLVEESLAAEGKTPEKEHLDELERRWQAAKRTIDARTRGAGGA
ncbi:MAG: nucleoside triphosphate pyrophosphohydrolase [Deltaproteobacteria bacterium]|nr:nucleoside triphosphate pyrophosphohydrolase [Deltaproteobacteria bacterium]